MSTSIKLCPNAACGRPFQVNEFHVKFDLPTAQGNIMCPHCGIAIQSDAPAIFLTHQLSAEEEARFNEQNRDAPDGSK